MARRTVGNREEVIVEDGGVLDVSFDEGPTRRSAPVGAQDPADRETIRSALRMADFEIVAEFTAQALTERPPAAEGGRRRGGRTEPPMAQPRVEVAVAPGESAVLLVEAAGGVFAWDATGTRGPAGGAGRRATGRTDTMLFDLGSAAPGVREPTRRGAITDFIGDAFIEPVRTYVLRFVAARTIDAVVNHIERDNAVGPVLVRSADVATWTPAPMPADVVPAGPARVLLLVHGTFSSTAGSFGQLAASDEGRRLLDDAIAAYDLVLGYDHRTLADDPVQNATALLATLYGLGLAPDSTLDAVAFSRGGLVYRALAEQLLPDAGLKLRCHKAVFVGCTNGGTNLAAPDNWAALVDVYTNVAVAAARGLGMLTGGVASPVLTFTIRTLGRFVQLLSEVAITDRRLPGLAAMAPDSPLIGALNGKAAHAAQPCAYHAVTSSFEPELGSGRGFSRKLARFVLDRISDRLMGEPNDLVVNTASMTRFGKRQKQLADDAVFAMGDTDAVYHTIYFGSEDVASRLSEWLGLASSPSATAPVSSEASPSEDYDRRRRSDDRVHRPFDHGGGYGGDDKGGGGDQGGGKDQGWDDSRGESDHAERRGFGPRSDRGVKAKHDDEPRRRSVPAEETLPRSIPRMESSGPGRRGFEPATSDSPDDATEPEPDGAPGAEAPVPQEVDRFVSAEMEQVPKLGAPVNVYVTVSPNPIEVAEHAAADSTDLPARLRTSVALELEIIPRRNCVVVGPSTREYAISPGEINARFEVQGTAPGDAELIVEARQGVRVVASFLLKPVFVDPAADKIKAQQPILSDAPDGAGFVMLRIYEFEELGDAVTLRFDIGSEDPLFSQNGTVRLRSKQELRLQVGEILRELEDAWNLRDADADKAQIYGAFMRRLSAKAKVRTERLIPENIRRKLWQHRHNIKAIQVISEDPLIPWELMYLTDPDGGEPAEAGFFSQWGLVRWLHDAPMPGRRLACATPSARYVIPEYLADDNNLEGAVAERAMLASAFPGIQPIVATSDAVSSFLAEEASDCDIMHFACHGFAEQKSDLNSHLLMTGYLNANNGIVDDPLAAEQVKAEARFRPGRPLALVFLNACQTGRSGEGLAGVSGFADAFIRPLSDQGVAAFVGALWSVDDQLALAFADAFYASLKAGMPLVEAVRKAREACDAQHDFTWLAYTVYGNPFARLG